MGRSQSMFLLSDERRDIHDFLAGLSDEEWATPSLCTDWSVLEVAAHLGSSVNLTRMGVVKRGLRYGTGTVGANRRRRGCMVSSRAVWSGGRLRRSGPARTRVLLPRLGPRRGSSPPPGHATGARSSTHHPCGAPARRTPCAHEAADGDGGQPPATSCPPASNRPRLVARPGTRGRRAGGVHPHGPGRAARRVGGARRSGHESPRVSVITPICITVRQGAGASPGPSRRRSGRAGLGSRPAACRVRRR